MTDYVIGGGDIVFHMMRIEGVKDGLVSGQFPVRIPPEWLFGMDMLRPYFMAICF